MSSLNRIKKEFEKISDNFSAKHLLCSCCCRYLELSELELAELQTSDLQTSENEKRFIFYGNNQCRNDATNEESVGYTYIEVREIESDLQDFEYSN